MQKKPTDCYPWASGVWVERADGALLVITIMSAVTAALLPVAGEALETDRGEAVVEAVVGQAIVLALPPDDVLSLGSASARAVEDGDHAFG